MCNVVKLKNIHYPNQNRSFFTFDKPLVFHQIVQMLHLTQDMPRENFIYIEKDIRMTYQE